MNDACLYRALQAVNIVQHHAIIALCNTQWLISSGRDGECQALELIKVWLIINSTFNTDRKLYRGHNGPINSQS